MKIKLTGNSMEYRGMEGVNFPVSVEAELDDGGFLGVMGSELKIVGACCDRFKDNFLYCIPPCDYEVL